MSAGNHLAGAGWGSGRAGLAVLLAVVSVGFVLPAGARAAAPSGGTDAKPVTVVVTTLEPKVVTARSTITVRGVLTNTTAHPMSGALVRLQAGTVLTSRSQLAAADRSPPTGDGGSCPFTGSGVPLRPHTAVAFTARCTAATLGISDLGVYPLVVNVNAEQFDGTVARVGEADTLLPYFPTAPRAPTELSWLWPIVDRPHRLQDGVYHDDELAQRLGSSGHVGRMVRLAQKAPAAVPLTVAVDPELVSEASGLTRPHRVLSGGRTVARTGSRTAATFLSALRSLLHRRNVTVLALPYGDPDVVALQANGLGDKLGTAVSQGTDILRTVLGVKGTERVAWPPGGQIDDSTLDALVGSSVEGIVLSSGALPTTGSTHTTAGAVAPLPAVGGTTRALVTDDKLDSLLGATSFPNGVRVAEQRFLAEVAMITAESPSTARTVLVAPPRRWIVPAPYAGALLADTAPDAVPWMTPAGLPSLLAAPASARRGPLMFPATAARSVLSAQQMTPVVQAAAGLEDFRGAVSNAAAEMLLTPYYRQLFVASSSAWRGHTGESAPYLVDAIDSVHRLRSLVSVIRPTNGTYSLASSGSPLVLTVENRLSVAAKVAITVTARGAAGFHAQTVQRTIAPHSRPTIKVPAKVERSGVFSVVAQVHTPNGHTLGQPVELKIRSNAYGAITLGITGGALALLFLLVGRRLYRRIRAPRQRPPSTPVQRPVEPVAP